jgi:hypothetical protein
MMEAESIFETSAIFYRTTQFNIPEDWQINGYNKSSKLCVTFIALKGLNRGAQFPLHACPCYSKNITRGFFKFSGDYFDIKFEFVTTLRDTVCTAAADTGAITRDREY